MNDDVLKGKWLQLKGQIKEKWGEISDDELDRIAGQRDQLIGKIQERYGIAKDAANRELDALIAAQPAESRRSGTGM